MKAKHLIPPALAISLYLLASHSALCAPRIWSEGGVAWDNETSLNVTLRRFDDLITAITVDYTTKDGSARAGVDYRAVSGTFYFASDETETTISIPLINANDGVPDGYKTFTLMLSNATAGVILEASEIGLVIQDTQLPANLDLGFKPVIRSSSDGDGRVWDLAILPDGKVLIAGSFGEVNGNPRFGLACLNVDGSLAPTFHTRLVSQGDSFATVRHITALADGRVYIIGDFDSVNGARRPGFARLLPDGALDDSFAPTISGVWPWTMALQPDGRVIANTDGGLVRLNENGSTDRSFVSGLTVAAFVADTDGKLLVESDSHIIRLNTNGSRDDSFHEVSLDGYAISLLVQNNRKILVASSFSSVDGVTRTSFVRLNADGSPDFTFARSSTGPVNNIRAAALTDDGKIVLLGRNNAWRSNADGSLDPTFPGFRYGFLDESVDFGVWNRGTKAAGTFTYVWGYFSAINGSRVQGLGRIFLDAAPRTAMDIQSAHTHDADVISSPDYLQAVGENEGVLRVKVRRLGETIGPASVTFGTRDGTAIAGRHYTSTTATLSFAPLEQEKIVTVPVLHNPTYDGPRTVELFLTNAVGATSLAPPVTMTIFDQELGFEPGAITQDPFGTSVFVRVTSGTANLEVSNDLKTWEYLQGHRGPSLFQEMFYDSDATKFPQRFYRLAK